MTWILTLTSRLIVQTRAGILLSDMSPRGLSRQVLLLRIQFGFRRRVGSGGLEYRPRRGWFCDTPRPGSAVLLVQLLPIVVNVLPISSDVSTILVDVFPIASNVLEVMLDVLFILSGVLRILFHVTQVLLDVAAVLPDVVLVTTNVAMILPNVALVAFDVILQHGRRSRPMAVTGSETGRTCMRLGCFPIGLSGFVCRNRDTCDSKQHCCHQTQSVRIHG